VNRHAAAARVARRLFHVLFPHDVYDGPRFIDFVEEPCPSPCLHRRTFSAPRSYSITQAVGTSIKGQLAGGVNVTLG